MPIAAIDIETISPSIDNPATVDFLDSRDFELAAIGVGYRAHPGADVETDVLWRRGIDTQHERRLITDLVEWVTAHDDITELITYNGVQFDYRHLHGRAVIVADELNDPGLPGEVHRALSMHPDTHRDLIHDVTADTGHRMAMEDAVEEYTGARPPTARWDGEPIENGDIPRLAQRWLTHRAGLADLGGEGEALRETLEEYVRADIAPLFELRDAVVGDE